MNIDEALHMLKVNGEKLKGKPIKTEKRLRPPT